MKTMNTLLAIIAINLTFLTLIQLEIWPPKAHANPVNSISSLPHNGNGELKVVLAEEQMLEIKSVVSYCDQDEIIERILYCIDGSTITDGTLSTYCNR
jgi:hypothetical protein